MKKNVITLLLLNLCSCGSMFWGTVKGEKTVIVQQYVNDLERENVPGTVYGPWAETMQQDVEVPGGLDPKAMYYRMPHRAIVEIRQEKFQRAQYPDADGVYRERE